MSFQHRFQYAGLKPYENERNRADAGEMTRHEYELLSQNDTYQKLAELRWLIAETKRELGDDAALPEEARANIFHAIAEAEVRLSDGAERYVEWWLGEHRAKQTNEA